MSGIAGQNATPCPVVTSLNSRHLSFFRKWYRLRKKIQPSGVTPLKCQQNIGSPSALMTRVGRRVRADSAPEIRRAYIHGPVGIPAISGFEEHSPFRQMPTSKT